MWNVGDTSRVAVLLLVIGWSLLAGGCSVWHSIVGEGTAARDTVKQGAAAAVPEAVPDTAVTAGEPKPLPKRLPTLREQMQRIVRSQERIEHKLDSLQQEVRGIREELAVLKALIEARPRAEVPDTTRREDTTAAVAEIAPKDTAAAVLFPDTVLKAEMVDTAAEQTEVGMDTTAVVPDTLEQHSRMETTVVFPDDYHAALRALVRKEYSTAHRQFQALLRRGDLHPVVRAYIYYWLGEIAFAQRQYAKAIEEFQRVLESKLVPKMDDALFLSAEAALRMKDMERAKQFYRKLVTQFPTSPYTPRARAMLQIL